MSEVLKMPDVREKLAVLALAPAAGGAPEMKAMVEGDTARWQRLAQELNIKPAE